jgi:HK97 gp10 family phage protein
MAKTRWKLSSSKKVNTPLEEAQKRLIGAGFEISKIVKESMRGGTGRIYQRGNIVHQASSPGQPPAVDTGRLRASISVNWVGSGGSGVDEDGNSLETPADGVNQPGSSGGRFRVVVGSNVEYAPYLEFGTRRMAARPFLRPAFDQVRSRILRMLVTPSPRAPKVYSYWEGD